MNKKESANHELDRLRQEDAKKSQFFLAASHQLKSPLAIIQWCLQSALESKDLKGKDREMVSKSILQADAMSRLITDMLHIVRLAERGKTKTLVPIDLNMLVHEVLRTLEPMAHRQQVHLVSGPLETGCTVLAEEAYLRQAVINLVDNAIKYSPNDGKVEVSLTGREGQCEISVRDQGIGIPDAEQSRLFTEFFRGIEAQAMTREGTGLGLVLVKRVVEEFGGEVFFKSALHKGSTFGIRLPKA